MMKKLSCYAKMVALCSLLLLLSSCAHRVKKDGPPLFPVDETKIPNAVPKKEPLSKYGNMRSYSVFGKRYYTMKSSRRFNETGVASWYGTQFHDRRTSSGEPYDMLAMTAAHKTLPLPTYVEVTNLRNKRKVIVKVNDRGPFESNRIIDLSYVAAKKLGMLGRGTAPVRIRAIDTKNPHHAIEYAHYKKSQPTEIRTVYLQVGSFKNKSHALKLKKRLSSLIRSPIKIVRSQNRLYRVKVGPINDITTMNRVTNRLNQIGITPNKTYGV